MKKLILGFLFSLGISSTLFAQTDLISLATNGAYNEQSEGVKVLTDEEMRQVVGGAQENRIAPLVGWGIRQGVMWGIRYTAWGVYNQRHPINGTNGWRW